MPEDDFDAAEENGDPADARDLFKWLSREVRELMPREVPVLEAPPTALAFSRDYVAANRPCVVRGVVDHWPARGLWTASYLSAALGDTPVSVNVTPTGLGDALLSTEGFDVTFRGERPPGASDEASPAKPPVVFVQPEARRMPFRAFRALVRASSRENERAPRASRTIAYVSAQNDSFEAEYAPRLGADLGGDAALGFDWARDAFGAPPDAVNLWCGLGDAVTSFHRDHYENVYVVLRGRKTFTLLPPCDAWRMEPIEAPSARFEYSRTETSPSASNATCRVVVETPVSNVSWPSATPTSLRRDGGPPAFVVTVRAGETLYLPAMWYHHVSQGAGEGERDGPRRDPEDEDASDDSAFAIAVNFWHDMRFDDRFATARFLDVARERARRRESHEGASRRSRTSELYEQCQ